MHDMLSYTAAWKEDQHLGREHVSFHFAVVTLVVVLPYTLAGIAFIVSLGIGNPTSATFIGVYFLLMCISPQMSILRVSAGRAWDTGTTRCVSTLQFSPGSTLGSQPINSNEEKGHLEKLSKVYLSDGHGKLAVSPV
ncbi:hypothetical protein L210DRAFT_380841 [Boletus edulis BED1]|uniref:Uncharacterized protein n=1 Tax=Boletus edulis BED1 TaxID=1328754 RepID=A0AAD4GGS2_BOLED|nr:hypothetical protein L210DRAFT_380841 [Boletus edulis BED1]